jgi:hypothetical protein
MNKIVTCLLLPLFLLLEGCAGSSQSNTQVYSEETRQPVPIEHNFPSKENPPQMENQPEDSVGMTQSTPADPGFIPPSSGNAAVNTLLQQAAQARAHGDYDRAQTLAERAQTLAPRDAQSYLELSRLHRDRGDKQRSRQMALRGLSVVQDDPATENALQLLSAP